MQSESEAPKHSNNIGNNSKRNDDKEEEERWNRSRLDHILSINLPLNGRDVNWLRFAIQV